MNLIGLVFASLFCYVVGVSLLGMASGHRRESVTGVEWNNIRNWSKREFWSGEMMFNEVGIRYYQRGRTLIALGGTLQLLYYATNWAYG
jgi:hypothetical protein